MSTVFLVDVSSSLVRALSGLRVCHDFYEAVLSLARSLRAEVVFFPSPEHRGLTTQTADLSDIQRQVDKVCGPTFERGTPLVRAVRETLASRQGPRAGLGTLVLVSDMLSDRSDDPGLVGEVTEMLLAREGEEMVRMRVRLMIVWIKRGPEHGESPCPALRLLESICGVREEAKCELDALERRLTYLYSEGLIGLAKRRIDSLRSRDHVKDFVEKEVREELVGP